MLVPDSQGNGRVLLCTLTEHTERREREGGGEQEQTHRTDIFKAFQAVVNPETKPLLLNMINDIIFEIPMKHSTY